MSRILIHFLLAIFTVCAAVRVAKVRALQARQASSRQRLEDLFQALLHRAFALNFHTFLNPTFPLAPPGAQAQLMGRYCRNQACSE